MKIVDRKGNEYKDREGTDRILNDAYSSAVGRACLKALSSPFISRAGGVVLGSKASAGYAYSYADKHGIDLFDYEEKEYDSFNDFFTRKIKSGRRYIVPDRDALVSPCDGKASAYRIADSDVFIVKNSVYTVNSLLRDKKLGKKYSGGTAVVIRLTPDDYHRYIYPADGIKSHNRTIRGALNTVRPISNEYIPVYKENSREYCMIRTERFGDIIQMEVGATLVGKINNYNSGCSKVKKGEEKGRFEFGGSTIVLLFERGKATVCADLFENTKRGIETKLRMGEVIAESGGNQN